MSFALPITIAILALVSILLSPKARAESGFFAGISPNGESPGLLTMILSQVTTWIFARSLLNAAILGFYYGIWGTVAYAAYYLSFLTGGLIIDSLRFKHGFNSVQDFLRDRFGSVGTRCYNFVIGLRLVSEVFANILVIGILFGSAGSSAYTIAVMAFAAVTLLYSMLGGLHASLRTDVFQMVVFIIVLVMLVFMVFSDGLVTVENLLATPFVISEPGPILLLVALLQIWSYPMHDPVMMDRGFIADRQTTRKSFIHAGWISVLCIMVFGSFGVIAGANAEAGEAMNAVLNRLLGDLPMFLFNAALVISAMSTLDSTLSSSAKLVAVDMRVVQPTIQNGRIVMVMFMLLGLAMVFFGNKDLFSAVAVSGTASMYLAPVVFFSLWAGVRDIPVWSYAAAFALAVGGAVLYFMESSGHSMWLGEVHKYTKLLWICLAVLGGGILLFFIGGATKQTSAVQTTV
ncbi:sodium:solute symporter family transporter [Alkalimarinus sediminis]|uniref:Sodium:proline symporter n=1 Tax=Alkalimarinus sediminis TaxID=1632866 RepID=A0A9E8HKA8_9ALTE|nr:sodium:proline symporter [Alkalimarinus sediminis]UZW74922.1 sodium:proline symporter [Alkalimarinus sediminis]